MYKLDKWTSDTPTSLTQQAEYLLKNSTNSKELVDAACRLKEICDNGKRLPQDYNWRCLYLRRLLVMKSHKLLGDNRLDFGGEQLLCMHATQVFLSHSMPDIYHGRIAISAFKRMIEKASKPRHWMIIKERLEELANSQLHKTLLAKAESFFQDATKSITV